MGLCILANTLREASYYFTGTSSLVGHPYKSSEIATKALAFIQGTSLEVMLEEYSIDLDANKIRAEFYRVFHATKS